MDEDEHMDLRYDDDDFAKFCDVCGRITVWVEAFYEEKGKYLMWCTEHPAEKGLSQV